MNTTRTITTKLRLETLQSSAGFGRSTAAQKAQRRRLVRYGLLVFNAMVVLSVGYMVIQSAGSKPELGASSAIAVAGNDDAKMADPLDRLSSADIAVNVARVAGLSEAVAVTNQADSENAQLAVVQASDSLVVKPQVVASAFKSNKDIEVYVAQAGDTAASIAARFHVTTDSILWSNNLASDNVATGQKLFIPPANVNGIVYVVKDGDTADSLAAKYHADKEKIIKFNDAELTGLRPGTRILIPDGQIVKPRPVYASSGSSSGGFPWGGGGPIYGSNGYIPGYCTFYVARRISVPSNWGNANTWDNLAPRSGWTVSTVPQPGAIGQTDRGAEGHVAVIEAVSEDGTMIKYSDMNGLAGYNRVGYSDWVSAAKFEHYIYR